MEKESGVPKPGDFFIRVIDLFAVLIPGMIAAAMILEGLRIQPNANVFFLSGVLITGWVLGHLLHAIGSWLDPLVYDPLFKPRELSAQKAAKPSRVQKYFHKNDELYRMAKQVTSVPGKQNVPGGMYQWARIWLDSHSPAASAYLDRLEADSKLFRSLAVLLLIAVPALIFKPELIIPTEWKNYSGTAIIIACAGVLFSVWRYCELRNKMIRRCYLHYVQHRLEAPDEGRGPAAGA